MKCHSTSEIDIQPGGSIALVGHPNVGKSVLFQRLTGQHATVSNYPGTTVEVMRGAARSIPGITVVDTPGVITLPPLSEDEQVTARVLLDTTLRAILQVGDAKNLRRTLLLTVQLAELGLPLVLALNMMDEAGARGVVVDTESLNSQLGLPVIPTTAVRGQGVETLTAALRTSRPTAFQLEYPEAIEGLVAGSIEILKEAGVEHATIAPRALALQWLAGDLVTSGWLRGNLDDATFERLQLLRSETQRRMTEPLPAALQATRQAWVETIVAAVLMRTGSNWTGLSLHLGRLSTHPVWGLFILAGVLYSMYWFVGVFGASTLVGLLEEKLFGEIINPWMQSWVLRLSPIAWVADLVVGDYGLWTMGMTYALALILPIVTTFFLAFSLLEDSGYLPRLAALSNRLFQALGLNGKAVLPMVLGLGCVTMATLTTRILESKRDRLLVTLLLALAVPCSAQLGVVMGMLAGISLGAAMIWGGVVLCVLLVVGWLAARLTPGERTQLLVELPPLRLPQGSNVLLKTVTRLEWYVKEVVPLFLAGAALMFVLDRIGVLAFLIRLGEPLVTGWLGLPPETSAAFLMGFLRRDFGAAGLFAMSAAGLLTPADTVVSIVTVTLFIPCIASVMMIAKERSWRTAAGMMVLIFPLAFLVGGLLHRMLLAMGWG